MTSQQELSMHENFRSILLYELQAALGCTEPIALALAGAKVASVAVISDLKEIQKIDIHCSGSIVKNVQGVVVPNSQGLRGIEIAVAMGLASAQADKGLEVLEGINENQLEVAKALVASGLLEIHIVENEENVYIRVDTTTAKHVVSVEIKYDHSRINKVIKDGVVLQDIEVNSVPSFNQNFAQLSLENILSYARTVDLRREHELVERLKQQIEYNSTIAHEGLTNSYGANVGKIEQSLSVEEFDFISAAAAGSDARMAGCSLPVIINSGSGNQGLTVSMPVIRYAEVHKISANALYRGLIVSNLLAIYQKKFIGKLSAFCGVVSAAASAAAGISFIKGKDYNYISKVIANTLATIGGMVCDGAKSSCAFKIAMALKCAMFSIDMVEKDQYLKANEGIVNEDIEQTIRNVGRMAKDGMKETDKEILRIMIGK